MKMQTYALALSMIIVVFVTAVPAFAQITEPLDNYDFVDFYRLPSGNMPEDVTFDGDGDRMFVFNAANSRIFEYSLSAAYDLSGARFARSIDIPRAPGGGPATVDRSVMDIDFSNNGMWFFLLGNDHETVYMYRLASPFTLTSTGYTYLGELDLTVQPTRGETPEFEFDPRGMTFSPDGRLLLVVGVPGFDTFNYRVYPLNTPFDIRTANPNTFVSSSPPSNTLHDVGISSGMSNLFTIRDSSIIDQYNSDGGFDGPLVADTLDLSSLDSKLSGIEFSDTGNKMFLTGLENRRVYEFVQNTQPPSFEPKSSLTLPEGTNLGDESGLKFTATDPDGSPVTYRLTGAPLWMSIDTNTGQLEGVIPYNAVLCSADTRIRFQVSASDDGFTGSEPDNVILNYELVVTSSPDPANSMTRTIVDSLVLGPSQTIIDLSLYTVDDDDDVLTYHDAQIASSGLISTASINENGILSITQNPGGDSTVLVYHACNGVDYIPLPFTLHEADNTPRLPGFLSVPDGVTVPEGTVISPELINFIATDPNGDNTLSYRLVDAPNWLEIDHSVDLPSVGRILGTVPYDAIGCEGGNIPFTFDVQISDDSFVDPANIISVQYTLTVTSQNRPGNNDPVIPTVLLYKGASTIDLDTFSFDEDGDALTYSNPVTDFLTIENFSPNGTMSVSVPHDPGSTGSMDITMCDGTNIVTRTAVLSVPVYEFVDFRDTPSDINDIRGIYFSNDGLHLFQVNNRADSIHETVFEDSFNITADVISEDVRSLDGRPNAIDAVFDNDGGNIFVIESDGNIFQYLLPNPFTLERISVPLEFNIALSFAGNPDTQPLTIRGADFSANGDRMYVVTSRGTSPTDTVYEFTLDRNFAIGSISTTKFHNISEHVDFAQDIWVSDDDGKLFIVDGSGDMQRDDTIVEYTFGSNLDLSTIDFSGVYSVSDQGDDPTSVEFSSNGYKMFVAEDDDDRINEYNIGVPFTMLSAPEIILPVEDRISDTFRGLSLPVTVNFTRPLTGFTADDITLVGSVNGRDPEVSNFTGSGASYSFNVERGVSDGNVDITIDRGVATDEFGHPNEASRLNSVHVDGQPVPFINSTITSPTNLLTISYTVEFSDSVTNFNATGIEVSGSANGVVENFVEIDDDSYTFDVSHSSVEGVVSVFIPEGVADESGASPNKNLASNRLNHTIDRIAPIPTLTSTSPEFTNSRTIPFTVTFEEPVTGFDHTGITVTGLAGVDENSFEAESDSVYNFDIVATADGQVTVQIPEDVAQDAAENDNVASGEVARTVDTIRARAVLSTDIDSPTKLAVIPYTVDFGEQVNGFVAADIDASIDDNDLMATNPVSDDGVIYTFNIAHGVDEGELTVSIPENVATDNAENNNIASESLAITIDRIAPTVTSASVINTGIIRLDVSETVFDRSAALSDFVIAGVESAPIVTSIAVSGSTITLTLNSLITDADDPMVSYTRDVGSIEDLATNPLEDFANIEATNDLDTTRPVPILTITSEPGTATHTNSSAVSYMVEFDMDVTGFIDEDIMVEGSADNGNPEVSNFVTVDDATYTFDVERDSSDGNVIVSIPENRATDRAGNQNVASDRLEITFDTMPPTATLASTESGDTRLRTIPVNVNFGERVDDFDINDIVIEGTATANTPTTDDNIMYMFDVIATADGDVTVSIRENAARDAAGNRNAESESIVFAVDTVRPFVGISTSTTSPTNSESISYIVEFREEINGFVAGDIDASIPGSTPTVTGPVLTLGNTQTYVVAHNSNEGILTVSIPENVATDNAGNNNTASNELVHTVDRIAPTVTGASVSDTDTIILEISESLVESGGVASDFTISGVATNPSVSTIVITGNTITLDLNGLITDADVPLVSYTGTVDIEDPAENPLADFASQIVSNDLDTTRPTVTSFTTTSSNPTNSQTITYMVQFSESVTGFSAAGIGVTGTSGGTAAEPTGAGRDYTFTVTRGSSDGTVTVMILENAARDADDNLSLASTPVEIVVDATPPTVTGASVSDTDTIMLEISEPVSGGAASDFTINGVASGPSVSSINIAGSTVTLELNGLITDADNPTVSYTETDGIEDLASNRLANFASQIVSNDLDTTRPTVTSFTTTSSNPTNSQTIMYEVQFSESVTGFSAAGIGVTGTSGGTAAEPTGAGRDYTFTVTRGSSDGTVTVMILENAARDADDNLSLASTPVEIVVDATPPTVTGASVSDTDTIMLEISEPVSGGAASDFTINGVATNPAVSSINIAGSTVTLELNGLITDADNPTVSYTRTAGEIEDAATNPLANFVGRTVTNNIDTTRPTVTSFTTTSPNPTNSQTIMYEVQFSEPVTRFNSTGIDVSGTSGGTAAEPTGSDRNYEFTVTRGVSDGTVTVTILEGAARDEDMNISFASSPVEIVADATPPTVTGADVVNPNIIRLDLSEPVSDDNAVASNFAISGAASSPVVSSIAVSGSSIELSLSSSLTDADNPTVSYTRTAGEIEDAATNPLANFVGRTVTNNIDTTRPTVTSFTTTSPNPTNSQTIMYEVQFSESVTRFNATGISVTGTSGGTAAEPTGAGRDYTFTVTRGSSDGTVTVTILEGAARDEDMNISFASSPVEIVVDATPPTVTSATASDTDTIILDISELLSESESVGVPSDFTISGVATNPSVSSIDIAGSTITLDLNGLITDADNPTVSYTETDGIEDLASNRLANFASQIVSNDLDTTRPTVTSFTTTSSNPTNSQTITYMVQFSEPVTGFSAAGISVGGTSGGTAAEPTGAGRDYTFTVTRGSSDGTVTVMILENAARDADDNLSFASSPVEIVVDATPPTVTGASVSDTDTIMLEISEPVSGGAASDFTINGVATNPAVSSINIAGSTVTLELNGLITDADNPTVSYTGTVDIEDPAENPLADFANESVTNNLDTTRPTVTSFTTTSSNPTNSQTITYMVQFSESVTGFSAAGIGVTGTSGGTAAEPTGAGRNYEFTVTRGSSDGTVTVMILENAARDADDNLSLASTPVEIVVDATPPTVTGADVVNPNIIRLDLSEPVSDDNAVASNFAISGAASSPVVSSIAVSGSSIELSLTPSLTDADNPTVSYTRTAGEIEDAATNRLANFAGFTVTNNIDTTAPVPTLSTDIDSPTNLAVMPYMVVFTEDVSGFDRGGIDASIDGASLTASNPVTNDNITYTFTVTHNVDEGELRVSIRAGAATDMDSNTSTASNTISRMIDRIAPTVTSATASDTDTIILEISEPVSGGAASDFTISGVATNPSVSSIDITGSTITLNLNGLITDADNPAVSYTGTVDIEDPAENPLADFANQIVTNDLDTTRPIPTLTITSEPGVTHTNSPTVSYRVEFDMDVDGFDEDDIEVSGSADGGNPEVSVFAGSGDTYTFDVERDSSDGNVIVSIPENRATDMAGNQNVASNRLEITFDTTPPTLMFASTESGDTKLRTIPFTVRFDEVVSGFDRNDIIIEGAATARQPTTSDDIFYEFDIVATSDGPVTVSIRENAALDMADNGNAASGMITLTVDTGRVRADLSTDILSPTNLATIPYTVDFGEQISGFTAADIDASVDGTPVTASTPVAGEGDTYTFGVTHGTDEGEVSVSIMAGAVTDDAGNTNDASVTLAHIVDRIAPTVTGATASDTDTIILEISEPVSGGVASDFTVTGVATNPSVFSIDITGSTITLDLNDLITDADNPVISYTGTVGIEDLAENPLADFAGQTATNDLDTTAPEPVLSTTASPVTSAVRLPFMVVFDMDVRDFDEGDIVLGGTASARINAFEGAGASYTFDVNRRSSAGTITVSIPANVAEDLAGNNNTASNTITITIDTDRPLPVITANATSFTNGPAILYTVTFDMDVDGFNATGINIGGSANGGSPEVSVFAGSADTYTFVVERGGSDGTVRVQVPGGVAMDSAENPNAASVPLTVTFDTVAPAANSGRVTGTSVIRLAMSEPVSDDGAAASDFTVSGVATNPAVSSISVSGSRMNLFLDGIIEEFDLPQVSYMQTSGNINDRATNPLADFANLDVTNDGASDRTGDPGWRTKPTFGSSHITGDPIVSCGYSIDGRCTDVLDYHVNYTRQTIQTNSTHDFALKTYAQRGVKQFELAFGVPDIGAPINNAEAVITIDLVRNYTEPSTHSIDKISYTNKNNVIGQNATFAVSQVKCLPDKPELDCIQLDITGVLFREQMYHVPFAIHATDYKLRGTINYLNEGILVQGETLNELPIVTRSTKSASQSEPLVIQLTRTDKLADVWTDQFGDTWTKNEWDTWRYVDGPTPSMVSSCRDIENRLCDAFAEKLDWHTANMERIRDSLYGKIYAEPAFDELNETIIVFGAEN